MAASAHAQDRPADPLIPTLEFKHLTLGGALDQLRQQTDANIVVSGDVDAVNVPDMKLKGVRGFQVLQAMSDAGVPITVQDRTDTKRHDGPPLWIVAITAPHTDESTVTAVFNIQAAVNRQQVDTPANEREDEELKAKQEALWDLGKAADKEGVEGEAAKKEYLEKRAELQQLASRKAKVRNAAVEEARVQSAMDQITSAIRFALRPNRQQGMAGSEGLSINIHVPTKLLIVTGTAQAVKLAGDVVMAMGGATSKN